MFHPPREDLSLSSTALSHLNDLLRRRLANERVGQITGAASIPTQAEKDQRYDTEVEADDERQAFAVLSKKNVSAYRSGQASLEASC